jgi:feruloyl-CoA synthase
MPSPSTDVDLTRREGGTLILRSRIKLEEVSGTICSYLPHWAREAPDRMFLAQRTNDNVWQRISYGEFWSRVRSVGQALLDRGGVAGDTLAILSGNSIENAIIQFGAMSVGLRVAPISPNYSLLRAIGGTGKRAIVTPPAPCRSLRPFRQVPRAT